MEKWYSYILWELCLILNDLDTSCQAFICVDCIGELRQNTNQFKHFRHQAFGKILIIYSDSECCWLGSNLFPTQIRSSDASRREGLCLQLPPTDLQRMCQWSIQIISSTSWGPWTWHERTKPKRFFDGNQNPVSCWADTCNPVNHGINYQTQLVPIGVPDAEVHGRESPISVPDLKNESDLRHDARVRFFFSVPLLDVYIWWH